MGVYIVNVVISVMIGLLFITLGIRQCGSEAPVTMNTGERPLKPEQLSDVKAWNTGHGKALVAFGAGIALEIGIFPVVLNFLDAGISTITLVIVVTAEIIGLVINHNRLTRMYKIER